MLRALDQLELAGQDHGAPVYVCKRGEHPRRERMG